VINDTDKSSIDKRIGKEIESYTVLKVSQLGILTTKLHSINK
jgi:hypothetical protein